MSRRILIIANRVPYPLNDGGNMATNAMIKGYHDAGYNVYLLSMNTSRHQVSDDKLAELYTYLEGFSTVRVNNDVKPLSTIVNYLFSNKPNHAVRFFHRHFSDKLIAVLQEFKPDIIQIESVFLSAYLPYIKQYSNAITVLRMHNVEYQIWQRLATETKNTIKKIYLKNLAKRIRKYELDVWRQYNLLLPITSVDADVVREEQINTPVQVAPFGLAVVPDYVPDIEEQWVGYHIGAMDWLPNEDAIMWFIKEIWPVLHREVPSFQFYFAGRHMPSSFDIQINGIHCAGEVPDAQKFIADKKILIVPLRSGGGIRIKILEAMAAGKVVITTIVGIQGIDATAGLHYLLADNPQAFTDAIKWCLSNKEKAAEIGQNAHQLIKEVYDNATIMAKITEKIASLQKSM